MVHSLCTLLTPVLTGSPVSNYSQLIHRPIFFQHFFQLVLLHGARYLAHEHLHGVGIRYGHRGAWHLLPETAPEEKSAIKSSQT